MLFYNWQMLSKEEGTISPRAGDERGDEMALAVYELLSEKMK